MTDRPPVSGPEAGLPDLAARLWADAVSLVKAEFVLAGVEAREALRGVAIGCAAVGAALVLAISALVALVGAAVHGLIALGMTPWLANLAVALVAVVIAWLCLRWAMALFRRAAGMPARTARNLKRDVETLANLVNRNA